MLGRALPSEQEVNSGPLLCSVSEQSASLLPHHSHALRNLQSEGELQDTPNQHHHHHQQEAQPAKRAKRADGGTVVASIRVPFPDTTALQGATALQRQLIVADFVAAALQAMAAEAGHPASSPSKAGGSAGLPSPTGETTELTFTDAAGTSEVGQPETSFAERAGIDRTSHQASPLLGAGRELSFGPVAAAAAADASAAGGGGVPAFGAAPDVGSCAKPGGAAGTMPAPAGLHNGLAGSTPGGANYSPVPVPSALHTGSPAGSQAATAGDGDATPSSSRPAGVPALDGDQGATRWQPSRLQNMAAATDALGGQGAAEPPKDEGAAEPPKDKGAAEVGPTGGLDSSALPQRQCGRRRRRSQAHDAAVSAAEPAAAAQQANSAAPAQSEIPAALAAAAAVPLPVEEAAKGGAVPVAQQALPSHAAASPAQVVSVFLADGTQDAKPAEAAAPAPVSAAAAAEALGSSGLHEDVQERPTVASPTVEEEAAEGVWCLKASLQASAVVRSDTCKVCWNECHGWCVLPPCHAHSIPQDYWHVVPPCHAAAHVTCLPTRSPTAQCHTMDIAANRAQAGQMATLAAIHPSSAFQHLGDVFEQHSGNSMLTARAPQTCCRSSCQRKRQGRGPHEHNRGGSCRPGARCR